MARTSAQKKVACDVIRAIRIADCDAIAAIEAQTFNTALDRGRLLNFMKKRTFCGFVDDANIPNTTDTLNYTDMSSNLVGYLLATIIADEAETVKLVPPLCFVILIVARSLSPSALPQMSPALGEV